MAKKKTEVKEEKAPVIQYKKSEDEISNEKRLNALFSLQHIDSQIDKIRIIRGELPLEVQDLEDEVAGLETRIDNYIQETAQLERQITDKTAQIADCQILIKKYEEQQMNVRNNREYDSLSKELEFQNLEIQLAEKRIKEYSTDLVVRKEEITKYTSVIDERKRDLEIKISELNDIVAETKKEELEMVEKSAALEALIDPRLLNAYKRIRGNARNGLAVVQIERESCGGCFNKIPPQHQLDIKMHKKIIVCEYCGRILIDSEFAEQIQLT
ncbi:MAG: C4-type zinc ribbon domain-containing protein [Bacteroidales bacterium]|jgi:predicted  nucleic acid-binding Zn-ribbon protein|nr:C4-type zinc ribbon domain-containing protein [Bacteroidales bacterium]